MKLSKIKLAPKPYPAPQTTEEIQRYYKELTMLERHLNHFFPREAAVYEHVANLPAPEKAPQNVYTAEYLPFHFKERPWMREYAANFLQAREPKYQYDPYTIEAWTTGTNSVRGARYAYKQRLIKAQIQYMLRANKANGIMSDGVTPANLRERPDYDKVFRAELTNAMTKLGIEPNFIEIGLETNADLWRRQTMIKTFENCYYPEGSQDPQHMKHEHCIKWLKQREYEYYQEHKEIIDKWGFDTRAMRMDDRQIRDIKGQVNYFNNMREEWLLSHPREKTANIETTREM